MAELKTQQNQKDVVVFLESVEHKTRRADSLLMLDMMTRVSGELAKMWGSSIVGFGKYSYKYASGHGGEFLLTGFSPRKQSLTIYIMPGFSKYEKLLAKLGKHKISKSCLYLNKLADVDLAILEKLIKQSVSAMRKNYPQQP